MADALISPSRRLRTTPYSNRVAENGATGYTVYNHMWLATVYGGLRQDYSHLKEYVQIWDVSVERQVEIKGPDAHKLACMISARDLSKAQVGRCYYAPICDQHGMMVNDPVALRIAEDQYWFSIADSDMLLWVQGLALGLDMDVEVCEPDVSPLAIQGPLAEDLMVDVFGEAIRDIKFFRFAAFPFKGRMLNIARSGWSKQGGFEIYLDDSSLGEDLWDAIWDKGEKYYLRPGCPNLIERIEGGLLSYGNDMTREDTPLEAGLGKFINLDGDADFIGKAALIAQRDAGVTKRLMGIEMDGMEMTSVSVPEALTVGGKKVGILTSAVYSPDYEGNIGFAMVSVDHAYDGAKVTVESLQGSRQGVICEISTMGTRVQEMISFRKQPIE